MRMLIQLQLSNYTPQGQFDLACDSGWQMCVGRAREMLKLDKNLFIDLLGPERFQLITEPESINSDVFETGRLNYIEQYVMPNAPATRYDFNFEHVVLRLNLKEHRKNLALKYDVILINDPCLLVHFRAAFHLYAGYLPKMICHSHFVDVPSNPKFPTEISLWMGQMEAALKADYNFWQCESALQEFLVEMKKWMPKHVKVVKAKSSAWDDGYSIEEMNLPINMVNVRFDTEAFQRTIVGKTVIFVPNRIGGGGRSSDYTQCGRFMFDVLPELWKRRTDDGQKECDFVVIAGNPNQKFSNDELDAKCGRYGYLQLVSGTFNRDEYRWLAHELGKTAQLALGWYTQDTFGGTASRELLDSGMMPVWVDMFEYSSIAEEVAKAHLPVTEYLCCSDFSNAVDVLNSLIDLDVRHRIKFAEEYQRIVRARSSFEVTTPIAYEMIKKIVKKS